MVVDASVIAAIVFDEPELERAAATIAGYRAVAPGLIDFEMANIALTQLRRRALTMDRAAAAMTEYFDLPIERQPVAGAELVALGHRFGVTAYDAAYLWLAGHLRAPLATFDARLASVAATYLSELPPAR
jgi:predicted nucleic acid-binding protein